MTEAITRERGILIGNLAFVVPESRVTLGWDHDAVDVPLAGSLKPQHAQITRSPSGELSIGALHPRGAVVVDGNPVAMDQTRRLGDGSRIRLGREPAVHIDVRASQHESSRTHVLSLPDDAPALRLPSPHASIRRLVLVDEFCSIGHTRGCDVFARDFPSCQLRIGWIEDVLHAVLVGAAWTDDDETECARRELRHTDEVSITLRNCACPLFDYSLAVPEHSKIRIAAR